MGLPMSIEPEITQDLIESHGLNSEEYQRLLNIIGRIPSYTELGIFLLCGMSIVHINLLKVVANTSN